MTDEELFGVDVCAELDAFADEAPELDEVQSAVLAGLLRPDSLPAAA